MSAPLKLQNPNDRRPSDAISNLSLCRVQRTAEAGGQGLQERGQRVSHIMKKAGVAGECVRQKRRADHNQERAGAADRTGAAGYLYSKSRDAGGF
jgi:hypothetical protein